MTNAFNLTDWFVDRHLRSGTGDHTALYTEDGAISYAELSYTVNRIGNVLHDLGVRPGDRVLLALRDGVQFVASWYATQKIGAVTAEVYTYLQAKDYAYYLRYTSPAVVIADDSTLEVLRAAGNPHRTLVLGQAELRDGELPFRELFAAASTELSPVFTAPGDPAIWKFTTGSTGSPKACVHPATTPLRSFEHYARDVLGFRPDDIVLPVPKLFFGYARDLAALYPFGVGAGGIVFPGRSTAEVIYDLIERYRPTILVNVPTMINAMLEHPRAATADLSSLRLCTSAGEALPEALHRRWRDRFGVEILDGIGSSEAYHIYLSNRPGAARPGTLGTAVPGYTLRLVDPAGDEVGDGEPGELYVTGDTVAQEYYQEPAKSAETFHGDTVRTGDLLSRDAEGYYRYHGRGDSMLKVGGVWVAPLEIENCLITHPGVLECAVVGYYRDGLQLPRAWVVRGSADVSAGELTGYVRTHLAPHKYPRDIRFVDRLPKTASGKLDRRQLPED
ncbi:benzoate-CoA ligase family protein [Pseudonocardiaceae bacterium YIM PH 21723]|nr:benzoate-CoA ligase family protein [Pseudonocardiaceae bacterium YIM PH 21723]